jgi:cation-transporting P-type ATPase E
MTRYRPSALAVEGTSRREGAGAEVLTGLSEAEAARRLAERGPQSPPATSRSYASIVRANVFTVFNLILLVFGTITLVWADWRDALFLGILVTNSGIGIAQEVRAKRALDRLAALVAPNATVVRDGKARPAAVEELVPGDLVRLTAGDQVVADGPLLESHALAVDEAILTGESRPVTRSVGEEVRSGSFAVEGAGSYLVEAVGKQSYASRVAGEARAFRHPRSPLERALNRLLLTLVAVMVPLGTLLGFALWERDAPASEAIPTSVAAVVSMVPEGLILLASLTYAVAALRMARKGALVQQINAVESLASVDVLCLDKTGTLTESDLRVVELVPATDQKEEEFAAALACYAASAPDRNATLGALAAAYPTEPRKVEGHVPFSSLRRWSALRLDGTSFVLGAPELFPLAALEARAVQEAGAGRRILAFGRTEQLLVQAAGATPPPEKLEPLGLVVLAERLRPEARETVEYFRSEGVQLKIISGDAPETVAAIAADLGIGAGRSPVDGRQLPDDEQELARQVLEAAVVGRISPEGKRRVIVALRAAGCHTAMVGDGVNDVPALKAAHMAIAQGTGSQMAKSVADVVLVTGDFAAVPSMVVEGRKILRNLQRVAKLFVTKSAFAAFLILSVGLTSTAYPLLPRHFTLVAALTVGIPSFFLALAPSTGAFKVTGFLREVSRFALPAGTAAGLGVVSSYLFALNVLDRPLVEARTVAATVLVAVGLYLIFTLEATTRRRLVAVSGLSLALGLAYALTIAVPPLREFFSLAVLDAPDLLTAVAGAGLAVTGLWLTDERFLPGSSGSSEGRPS